MKLDVDTKKLKEAHFIQNKDGRFDVEFVHFPTQRECTRGYMRYCDTVHSICNLENVRLNGLEIDIEEKQLNNP